MITEIDKIVLLKEKATEEDKKRLIEVEEVFAETFKAMIAGASTFILEGEVKKATLEEAKEALEWINKYAAERNVDGIEFPSVSSPKEVATYVLKYGKEIIYE